MIYIKENTFYIYCHIKKTDGKCFYIGKGSGKRYKAKESRNPHWWNIVNKHGFESIILVNNISEIKAFELEAYFCKQIGYKNLCNVREELGNGGWSHSKETKQQISNMLKGRVDSEETKFKKRKPHILGSGNKISKSKTGMSYKISKFILQYDLKGNFIKEYHRLSDIKQIINKPTSAISECCSGKRKTAYDYIWKNK